MTKAEFAIEWKALVAVPLTDRPRDDAENKAFMAEAFRRLEGWPAKAFHAAITEYLETPNCETCHRTNRRFPLWGELLLIMRRMKRANAQYQSWPENLHSAVALVHAKDDGYQPACPACDDTGWRPIQRGDAEGVEKCECQRQPVNAA